MPERPKFDSQTLKRLLSYMRAYKGTLVLVTICILLSAVAGAASSMFLQKLIDGYIVHIDTGPVRAQTAELQKIGVNINQIARRINSTGTVYAQDLEDIKGALAQIWQLQRSILSSQR